MKSHDWKINDRVAWTVNRYVGNAKWPSTVRIRDAVCQSCGMKVSHDTNNDEKITRGKDPEIYYRTLRTEEEDCESMTVRLVMSE